MELIGPHVSQEGGFHWLWLWEGAYQETLCIHVYHELRKTVWGDQFMNLDQLTE